MIFESHAHYDDEEFDEDRESLLQSLPAHDIGTVINVCAAAEDIDKTVELMERYPYIYGAVGVHPEHAVEMREDVMAKLETLCAHPKTVAVGEIGLDYYWDKEHSGEQKEWFRRQLSLAYEAHLPFIIHSRDAAQDTWEVLSEMRAGEHEGGVIHCFSYSVEEARKYLDLGLYLGVGGVVTFKNGKKLKEVVRYAPLSQLLLETDCPYLAPEPMRGKRNCSLYLPYIAEEIARIKDISYEEVVDVTCSNAKRLFRL